MTTASVATQAADNTMPRGTLVVRMREETGCPEELARRAVDALEPFLDACAESRDPISPSRLARIRQ